MKKIITVILCLVASIVTMACFAGCESSLMEEGGENHTFGEWYVSIEATCETKGEERRDCKTCKHYEVKEVEALGHDIVSFEAKEPTHLEGGYNAYEKCSRCEYSTYAEIETIAHEFVETVVEPTCYAKGYTNHACECGYSYQDNYVDEIAHEFGEYEITLEPTCTEKGKEERCCTVCEFKEEREVKEKGHLYVVEVVSPTCLEDGYVNFVCKCGHKYAQVLPKVEHTESEELEDAEGLKYVECTECGTILRKEEPEVEEEPEENIEE